MGVVDEGATGSVFFLDLGPAHVVVQPAKDRLEHLAVVQLHHHQMPVAVDTVIGQDDSIDVAARVLEERGDRGARLGQQRRLRLDERDRDPRQGG